MSTSVGNTVNIRQYPFSLLYSLLRVRVCKFWYHCHCLEISISFSLFFLKMVHVGHTPFAACRSIVIGKGSPNEIWPNSYKPIIIMQNVTNDSRSHSYRLIVIYLDNKTARGKSVTLSYISWRSVLLVEETEDPQKTTNLSQVTDKLDHIMLYTSSWSRFDLTTSMVIGTDCIGSCRSNYHTITATTASSFIYWPFITFEHFSF